MQISELSEWIFVDDYQGLKGILQLRDSSAYHRFVVSLSFLFFKFSFLPLLATKFGILGRLDKVGVKNFFLFRANLCCSREKLFSLLMLYTTYIRRNNN